MYCSKNSDICIDILQNKASDEEFQTDDQDEEDMEDTIEEQEKHENKDDHVEELSELQKESKFIFNYRIFQCFLF